ncbi:GlxA family transcriptional regulator, partial [Actinomadura fibrosa]
MSPFRSIAVYVPQRARVFELGMVVEVFADRTSRGLPSFEVSLCTGVPGEVLTDSGLTVEIEHGLDRLGAADLVVLLPGGCAPDPSCGAGPPGRGDPPARALPAPASPALVAAVRAAYERGAILAGLCCGSFPLADAGLLDGRRVAVHWSVAADFAARYPAVRLAADALYADEGRIVTGAGAAAGLDMLLHVLRREHGAAVAGAVAR